MHNDIQGNLVIWDFGMMDLYFSSVLKFKQEFGH